MEGVSSRKIGSVAYQRQPVNAGAVAIQARTMHDNDSETGMLGVWRESVYKHDTSFCGERVVVVLR